MSSQQFYKALQIAAAQGSGEVSNEERSQAEVFLKQIEQQNFPIYLTHLVTIMADESNPAPMRQLAGLLLKHNFESKTKETKQRLVHQWNQIPDNLKQNVRDAVVKVLASPVAPARKAAAQALAAIASIDLMKNEFVQVLPLLYQNVVGSNLYSVESSLMTLGYLCEECKAVALEQFSDKILSSVIHVLSNQQQSEVIYAAIVALYNSLEFMESNFERDLERNKIMTAICTTTQKKGSEVDTKVRQFAMRCLVRIAFLYYDYLNPEYIAAIKKITFQSAAADAEQVAMQAVEFWATLSEIETEIIEENNECIEIGEATTRVCYNFVLKELSDLVNLLTHLLTKQNEYQSDEEWNLSSSAGTCLTLVARTTGDNILSFAIPFIGENIKSSNWRQREAAILAFSAILDGPSQEKLEGPVQQALPFLIQYSKTEQMELVKDTTIFTIGKIAQFQPNAIRNKFLNDVLSSLLMAMQDSRSRIASKACWSLFMIATLFETEDDEVQSNELSQSFQIITQALFACASRPDIGENNLRMNTHEALSQLIMGAARDMNQFLQAKVVPELLKRASEACQRKTEESMLVQASICGCLHSCTEKLGGQIIQYALPIMQFYSAIFRTQNTSVFEDAMMGSSAMIVALGENFAPYLDEFFPFLMSGLHNYRAARACLASVNVVGHLFLALKQVLFPSADAIMHALLKILQSEETSPEIKPVVINCFSDIAFALGVKFEKYIKGVAQILKEASQITVNQDNPQMVDYLNDLRENILETYIGILQGLKIEKPQAFLPFVQDIFQFLKIVHDDENADRGVFKRAVTVIGDLANVYRSQSSPVRKALLQEPYITKILEAAKTSGDKSLEESAIYAWSNLQVAQ